MKSKTTELLKLKGLTKAFGATRAVNDLSLSVRQGEIYGFLGPNGAGKTTTIRMILGILKPDAGSALLFGVPGAPTTVRRKIGYLSSDMALDDDLTGRQYLDYVSGVYGKDCRSRSQELAHRLDAKLDVRIANYSRGNRQKLVLIAALMHEPELLIMDEPTSGFDPLVQETFIKLVREFRSKGGTVFMSSHILGEVQQLCDRVGFIRDGRLVGETDVSSLGVMGHKSIKVTGWKKPSGDLKGLREVSRAGDQTVLAYDGDMRKLLAYFAGQNIRDITIQPPDLEDEFIDYYQVSAEKESQHA